MIPASKARKLGDMRLPGRRCGGRGFSIRAHPGRLPTRPAAVARRRDAPLVAHTIGPMSDPIDNLAIPPGPEAPPPSPVRPSVVPTLLAWLVIVALVTFYVLRRDVATEAAPENGEDRAGLVVMQMQARYFI